MRSMTGFGRAEIERVASTFRRIADTYSALFIVNDDPDLARACDADGVHVGQDDASVEEARALLLSIDQEEARNRRVLLPNHGLLRAPSRRYRPM